MTRRPVYTPVDVARAFVLFLALFGISCGAAANVGQQATHGALLELEDAGPPLAAKMGHDTLVGAVRGLSDSDADAGSPLAREMGRAAVAGAASSMPAVLSALPPSASAITSAAVAGASPGVQRVAQQVLVSVLGAERGAVADVVDAGFVLEDHGEQAGLRLIAATDAMLTKQRQAAKQDAFDVLAEGERIILTTQQSAQKVEWTAGGVLLWAALGISTCITAVSLALHWKRGGSMAKGSKS